MRKNRSLSRIVEAMTGEKLKRFSGTRKNVGKNLLDGYGEELEKAVCYLEESEKWLYYLRCI